jgi:hypothetical protein
MIYVLLDRMARNNRVLNPVGSVGTTPPQQDESTAELERLNGSNRWK